jgi:hypothetical protein
VKPDRVQKHKGGGQESRHGQQISGGFAGDIDRAIKARAGHDRRYQFSTSAASHLPAGRPGAHLHLHAAGLSLRSLRSHALHIERERDLTRFFELKRDRHFVA